jgi:hypothetical protein
MPDWFVRRGGRSVGREEGRLREVQQVRWRRAPRRSAVTRASGTGAGRREFGVSTDAYVIDADDVDQRVDILRVFEGSISEVGPDADQASGVGDNFGLLFADEPWAHHLGHARIAPELGVEAGMGDDDGTGGDLECSFRGLHVGVSKIDEHAEVVAFLDDVRAECGQSAEARRAGVNIAQRHGGVGFYSSGMGLPYDHNGAFRID